VPFLYLCPAHCYSNLRDFAIAVLASRKPKQGFKIAYYPKRETTEEEVAEHSHPTGKKYQRPSLITVSMHV
jgi:hypothetical protein